MATISDVNAVTQQFYVPSVVENIFNSNPLFFKWWQNRRLYDGGTDVVQPVALSAPTGVGSYVPFQQFNTDTSTHLYGAELAWANYYATIVISGIAAMKNSGPNAVCNFIEVTCKLTEMALRDLIGNDLYGLGTASSTNPAPCVGLQAMYGNATTAATYANIARATFAAWIGNVSLNSSTARALTLPLFNSQYILAMIDSDRPDLFLMSNAIWGKWANLIQPQQRHIQSPEFEKARLTYDIGFEAMSYMGKPFVVDSHVSNAPPNSNDVIYMINNRWINIFVQSMRAFEFQDFLRDPKADTATAQVLLSFCPFNTQPRQGVILGDLSSAL